MVTEIAASSPIGERIQSRLTELGESASWLAVKGGFERSTITRILKGERHPTPETLAVLAVVLGVSLEQLVAGTTAAARVKEARGLVSRQHYDAAIQQLVDYERKANEASLRARDAELATVRERERRVAAESALDGASREAQRSSREARDYHDAFHRALTHIGQLETQLRELGAAVDETRRNARVAAIVAGTAACASLATFLWRTTGEACAVENKDDENAGVKTKRSSKRQPQSGTNPRKGDGR